MGASQPPAPWPPSRRRRSTFQGMAFGGDGYLYLQYTSGATRILTRTDPNSGAVVSSTTILNPNASNNTAVTDLASCTPNSTVTLRKDVAGRYAAADQFTVAITGNGVSQGNTGTTSGATTGVQTAASASAGPVVGVPGRTYTLTETPAAGTDPTRYTSTWSCTNASGGGAVIASGTGTSGTITMPAATAPGSHVVCVFRNVPILTWVLAKSALRGGVPLAPGALVRPGDTISYQVTASNTTASAVTGVVLTDDLADVLDDATFVPASAQLTIGTGAATSVSNPAGTVLTTTPFTLPAAESATLTYQVVVGAAAWSATLRNVVSGTSANGTLVPCPTTCTTTQVTPALVQIQKVGEDSSGQLVPMDGSAWAIYATATGGTPLVAAVAAAPGSATGLFQDTSLTAGTYWIAETRALDGFALLAQRVAFTVATDGTITLPGAPPSNVAIVQVAGVSTIRVTDVPALALPEAGGTGTVLIYAVGIVLLAAASISALVVIVRRRRPPRRREGAR